MSAKSGRTHNLSKIHSCFTKNPKFHPIIETSNTPYYKVRQYLSSLLQAITINNYTLKDFFGAVNKIKSVPSEIFEEGYQSMLFDVSVCVI